MESVSVTLGSLVLFLLFVLPGTVVLDVRHRILYTKRPAATDLAAKAILYSVLFNFLTLALSALLITLATLWPSLASALHLEFLTTHLSTLDVRDVQRFDLLDVFIHSLLLLGYALTTSGFAWLWAQHWYGRRYNMNRFEDSPVLHMYFSVQQVNKVVVRMREGQIYHGVIAQYPNDYDTSVSDARDIVLEKWRDISPLEGVANHDPMSLPQMPTRLLLNTRDIVSIELLQEAPSGRPAKASEMAEAPASA